MKTRVTLLSVGGCHKIVWIESFYLLKSESVGRSES